MPYLLFIILTSFISISAFAQLPKDQIQCGLEVELAKGFKTGSAELWPSQIIPYDILSDAEPARNAIRAGILALNARTNVCLVPKGRRDVGVIKFIASSNTVSSSGIGYTPNGTTIRINIQGGGFSGTVIHEVIHSLGFWHEHQRPDRDDFIDINFDNIQNDFKHNFTVRAGDLVTPYDFTSIMHYPPGAFNINSNIAVIEGKNGEQIGSQGVLTQIDIDDINYYYPKNLDCDSLYALFPPIPRFNFEHEYSGWCKGYRLSLSNQTTNRELYDSFWEIKSGGRVVASGEAQDTTFFLADGEYSIALIISNQSGSNSSNRDISLDSQDLGIRISPNPVGETLLFRIDGDFSRLDYSIWNLDGKKMLEKELVNFRCESQEEIDLQGIGSGMYFIKVHAGEEVLVKSFLKQ
ncbi:MAG: zinc-dependent metalloprotease [Bacteroidia bacterium]|nr:zinc-dependent metalloprotease [Bacteroidia bacterium]